nr:hypothetical protein [Methylomarinum sp. Ch1-1]MDP4519163.1 hypothetical protein [Methylomarinum sp. Ch1-1]
MRFKLFGTSEDKATLACNRIRRQAIRLDTHNGQFCPGGGFWRLASRSRPTMRKGVLTIGSAQFLIRFTLFGTSEDKTVLCVGAPPLARKASSPHVAMRTAGQRGPERFNRD